MRFALVLVAAMLLAGCTAPALPASGPDAMAIVWEQTYGMETAARPSVTWHDECRVTDSTGNRATSIKDGCVVAIVHDDGAIDLQSAPLISDTAFTLALEEWKRMLVASEFAPIDGAEVKAGNDALVAAGL